MNISHESNGELTATLKVEVSETDYSENVNKTLREYQRKANMPGFRPGKVPIGMIRKLYGHAAMMDEINKLVSKEITSYIHKKGLKTIGYPIPDYEKGSQVDFDSQSGFELFYDLGFKPDFELQFSDEIVMDYYKIMSTDEHVDKEITELAKSHGTYTHPETSEELDWIDGFFEQLGEDGLPLKDGISVDNYLIPKSISSEEQKAHFIGLKKDDIVTFNIREVFPNNRDIERLLKVKASEAPEVEGMISFTVNEITRLIPAEINEDLFKKVLPDKEDVDETKFREFIRSAIDYRREPESDRKFFEDAKEKLLELHTFNLPEDFLKKLMLDRNPDKISKEDIEEEFPSLIRSLKWDLIKEKIYEKHDIAVTEEEKRNLIGQYFRNQVGMDLSEDDTRISVAIDKVLNNEEDDEKIESQLLAAKLLTVMKNILTLQKKEVSLGEFMDIIGNVSAHHHDHVHDEHCDHDHGEHSHEENV